MNSFLLVKLPNGRVRYISREQHLPRFETTAMLAGAFDKLEISQIRTELEKTLPFDKLEFYAIPCDTNRLLTAKQRKLINAV